MPTTNRIVFNILSKDIENTTQFYENVAGLTRIYTSDWYNVLSPEGQETVQLGIIDEVHEIVPTQARGLIAGTYLTLVVDNLKEALSAAQAENAEIMEQPVDQLYGQRRALIRDPDGLVVDLSEPIEGRPQSPE